MIPAYPLQWPITRERSKTPRPTQYSMTLATAYEYVSKNLALLDAKKIVISSNAFLKKNGLPAAKQPKLADTGVAVWFQLGENQAVWYSLSCDVYDSIASNLKAIGLSASDIRKVTQRLSMSLIQVFTATPPYSSEQQQKASSQEETPPEQEQPKQDNGYSKLPGWCIILSINTNATWLDAKRAYYRLAKVHHPDLGGNPAQFQELNMAYLEAKIHYGIC